MMIVDLKKKLLKYQYLLQLKGKMWILWRMMLSIPAWMGAVELELLGAIAFAVDILICLSN